MSTEVPAPIAKLRRGQALSDLEAAAAKLWLAYGGAEADRDGILRRAVKAHWASRTGRDPYWDFLATRDRCVTCGEGYTLENLAICPNCLKTYCYRHKRECPCGHVPLG